MLDLISVQVIPLPSSPRGNFYPIAVGNKVFCVNERGSTIWCLDLESKEWTERTPRNLPNKDEELASCFTCVNSSIFAVWESDNRYQSKVICYDTERNSWSYRADIKTRFDDVKTVAVNQDIYFMISHPTKKPIYRILHYNTNNGKWKRVKWPPQTAFGQPVSIKGKLVLFGKHAAGNSKLLTIYTYNSAGETWEESCLNSPMVDIHERFRIMKKIEKIAREQIHFNAGLIYADFVCDV